MSLSSITHLVLIVIVIVVVVALLFGFEGLRNKIMGFYDNIFGTGNQIQSGKALHVRLDARNGWLDPFELYQFHLTGLEGNQHIAVYGKGDMKGAFYLDTSSQLYLSNCVILTSLEGEGTIGPDWAFIYYVSPGSRVQEQCDDQESDNLGSCVNVVDKNCSVAYNYFDGGKIGSDDCYCWCDPDDCWRGVKDCPSSCSPIGTLVKDLSCTNKFGYVVSSSTANCPIYDAELDHLRQCDFAEWVFNHKFEPSTDTTDKCESSSLCNLLVTEGDKHVYMVKYGLLCDDEIKWKVCTDKKTEDSAISAGGKKYICCPKPDDGVFVWEDSEQCI